MKKTYNHTGIPVFEKQDDMMYVECLKVWITDASKHPYKIEFLYFEPDSPVAAMAQEEPHVAYVVENIEEAVKGKSVLIPVTDMGAMKIAYVYDAGVPVEFIEKKK